MNRNLKEAMGGQGSGEQRETLTSSRNSRYRVGGGSMLGVPEAEPWGIAMFQNGENEESAKE